MMAVFTGCSTMDDDEVNGGSTEGEASSTFAASEKPGWSIELMGNDAKPNWVAPNPSNYESSMVIMVKLQNELVPYSTDDDRMTIFIGNECRARPSVRNIEDNGDIYFVLNIWGNSSDRDVTFGLHYYCAALHQIFTLRGIATFVAERTYGIEEDYVPPLLKGCKKYPIQNTLFITQADNAPFVPATNDLVAVFVGNECRGVGQIGKAFTVFRTSVNETLQLRYYSSEKGGIYTLNQTVTMGENENKTINIAF
jgi:hypothetical protein